MAVNLEFENKLWEMADKLRGNIQPSDRTAVGAGGSHRKDDFLSDCLWLP